MQKYEPENLAIDMDSKQFKGKEKIVFAGIIEIHHLSAKAKFGQNIKDEQFQEIIEDLNNNCHYFRYCFQLDSINQTQMINVDSAI